jgi:hypothetical protein
LIGRSERANPVKAGLSGITAQTKGETMHENYTVETFTEGELSVRIEQDPEPMNPRKEFDQFGHMLCWHRNYNLGDQNELSVEQGKALAEYVEKDGGIVLPLFLMDHSEISMSTNSRVFRACDSAGWDWGQVGFIYATKEDIIKNWGIERITAKLRKFATECLEAEVAEYNQYLTGDVYGYTIEDANGEHIDSCWGFFGLEYCHEEAKDAAKAAVLQIKKDAEEAAKQQRSNEEKYPVADWQYEVANGDTLLGYKEWVDHRVEASK